MAYASSGRLQKFLEMLTAEQHEQLNQLTVTVSAPQPLEENSQIRTEIFHRLMTLPATDKLDLSPSVSQRELRLRLLLEEVHELAAAMGFCIGVRVKDEMVPATVMHVEGSRYDIVEAYDAICDIDVINNGTAVALGFVIEPGAHEVYCSNLTKLDENGQPIVNGVSPGYRNKEAMEDYDGSDYYETGYDPTKPVGKLLKPANYKPANLTAILYAHLLSE